MEIDSKDKALLPETRPAAGLIRIWRRQDLKKGGESHHEMVPAYFRAFGN